MEKDEIKKRTTEIDRNEEKICSKCKRAIQPGEYYIEDILTDEITCSDCDDKRILVKGEAFFSID
ncbi:MAG: hypothetical protein EU544_04315 [Promethearchaeota archaeon]|nr:MAG: hypothetical protein EU544_04315 [Candidatus Lokiarchaeota archaeon]